MANVQFFLSLLCYNFLLSSPVRASDSLLSPKGVNFEVAALMLVKSKMVDKFLVLSGWDINSVDPCTWNMVGCSAEGFVVSLLLQNNQLSGPIPVEIGKLSQLQTLDLSGNQIDGEIPSSLGYLTHLTYLDLSFNNLSGPTPKILAKGYSVKGNSFLCNPQTCEGDSKPINGTGTGTTVPPGKSNRKRWIISLAAGVSCTFVISVVLIVCGIHWYRSRLLFTSYVQQDYELEIGHLKRFPFRELQAATGNFSPKNILGQGGFGVVYKGTLPDNTM
ncbi:hypothetical protein CRG98_028994, partial [Punica granatum]